MRQTLLTLRSKGPQSHEKIFSLPTIFVPLFGTPQLVHSGQFIAGTGISGLGVVVGLIPKIVWIHCMKGPGICWRSAIVLLLALMALILHFVFISSCWCGFGRIGNSLGKPSKFNCNSLFILLSNTLMLL